MGSKSKSQIYFAVEKELTSCRQFTLIHKGAIVKVDHVAGSGYAYIFKSKQREIDSVYTKVSFDNLSQDIPDNLKQLGTLDELWEKGRRNLFIENSQI